MKQSCIEGSLTLTRNSLYSILFYQAIEKEDSIFLRAFDMFTIVYIFNFRISGKKFGFIFWKIFVMAIMLPAIQLIMPYDAFRRLLWSQ